MGSMLPYIAAPWILWGMNHMLNNKKHHEMEEEHRRPDFSSDLNPNCSMVDPPGLSTWGPRGVLEKKTSSALGPETGVALAWIKTSCQCGVNGKQQ